MAAGLGFKTFTTGEVLTAADVNGYLMQGINVFASSAARSAAITSPQEGQYSFLKDTNALEYYDGAAWVGAPVGDITAVTAGKGLTGGGSSGDVTVSLATTAKGDLVAGSGASTAAVLTVGSNGETLVADSSATTGLRWQGDYAAGKNKIINGDFGVWQRGTSITVPTGTTTYTTDRYYAFSDHSSGTASVSRQTFSPGTAPVAGYEGQYFARWTQGTGATYWEFAQKIEDVRTYAGQTVTFSFWAKASANASINLLISQIFGSGGSGAVTVSSTASITTSWARYSATLNVPSISGKTIGTGSSLQVYINQSTPVNSLQIDFWGWQVEAGSVATAFQTATGTIQGELAACQRYYYRQNASATNNYQRFSVPVGAASSTQVYSIISTPVTMRTTYSSIDYTTSGLAVSDGAGSFVNVTGLAVDASSSQNLISVTVTVASGLTTNRPYYLLASNSSTPYVGLSAEL